MARSRLLSRFALGLGLLAPASAFAQAPVPVPDIENFTGILFYCKPLANEVWTRQVCEDMNAEMKIWAARAKKPIALLTIADTRETNNEKAKAAGFDPKNGLWVLLTVEPRANPVGWDLKARADGISSKQPATAVPQTTTYSKSGLLARGASAGEATASAKALLGAIMTVLTTPMRPL